MGKLAAIRGMAFHSLTVSSAAKTLLDFGFTAAQIAKYDAVQLTVVGGALRYCYDGSTPTAIVGHLVDDRASIILYGQQNISNLKMIRETGDVVVAATVGDLS